jgi:diphthamide biosynthesis protein 2
MLDFEEVLTRGPPVPLPDDNEEADTDRPEFSLVSGRYRHAKRYGGGLPLPSHSHLFLFLLRQYVTENDRTPAPEAASSTYSALIPRNQDGTVTTLRDSAAGMPFSSLCNLVD